MNKQQLREELLMDKQEIETTFDMGYFETNMELDLYSIEEALLALDNEEYEVKNKRKNKNRYEINKKHKEKMYDRHRRDVSQEIATHFAEERCTYREEWGDGMWTLVRTCKPWWMNTSRNKRPNRKKILKAKAKKKVRYSPVGKENFSLKGCGYHKVYEWKWDME